MNFSTGLVVSQIRVVVAVDGLVERAIDLKDPLAAAALANVPRLISILFNRLRQGTPRDESMPRTRMTDWLMLDDDKGDPRGRLLVIEEERMRQGEEYCEELHLQ